MITVAEFQGKIQFSHRKLISFSRAENNRVELKHQTSGETLDRRS